MMSESTVSQRSVAPRRTIAELQGLHELLLSGANRILANLLASHILLGSPRGIPDPIQCVHSWSGREFKRTSARAKTCPNVLPLSRMSRYNAPLQRAV